MFGIFQRSSAVLSYFVAIDGFQFFGLALPIFVLACFGLAAKSRFPFTVATHLSAAYAGFLVLSWQVGAPTVSQASLGPIAVPSGVGLYVMATILGTCLLSFAITHLLYFCAVREEISALMRILQKRIAGSLTDGKGGALSRILSWAAKQRLRAGYRVSK